MAAHRLYLSGVFTLFFSTCLVIALPQAPYQPKESTIGYIPKSQCPCYTSTVTICRETCPPIRRPCASYKTVLEPLPNPEDCPVTPTVTASSCSCPVCDEITKTSYAMNKCQTALPALGEDGWMAAPYTGTIPSNQHPTQNTNPAQPPTAPQTFTIPAPSTTLDRPAPRPSTVLPGVSVFTSFVTVGTVAPTSTVVQEGSVSWPGNIPTWRPEVDMNPSVPSPSNFNPQPAPTSTSMSRFTWDDVTRGSSRTTWTSVVIITASPQNTNPWGERWDPPVTSDSGGEERTWPWPRPTPSEEDDFSPFGWRGEENPWGRPSPGDNGAWGRAPEPNPWINQFTATPTSEQWGNPIPTWRARDAIQEAASSTN